MLIRRRDIGLIPASKEAPAVYRTAAVIDGKVYWLHTDPSLDEATRDAEIKKIVAEIESGEAP